MTFVLQTLDNMNQPYQEGWRVAKHEQKRSGMARSISE